VSQVVINGKKKQVEMWLVSKGDTGEVAPGISIAAGERVLVEISRKFTVEQLQGLAYNAGLYMQVARCLSQQSEDQRGGSC